MRRLLTSLVFVALLACGCDSLLSVKTPQAQFTLTTEVGPTTPPAVATETSAPVGNCYYVWASHDLPDLSQKIASALQAADPGMSGGAYAYGEDCVFADGRRDFSAMETDFRVRIKVVDLKDEEALGNSIARAVDVIDEFSSGDLAGGHAGRIDFAFYRADLQELHLNVDLDKYHGSAQGIRGAQLFRLFFASP